MEFIIKSDNGINQLLGLQEWLPKKTYKPSFFVISSEFGEGEILWNSFTGHMIFLNKKECAKKNNRFVDSNVYRELVKHHFYVSDEINEYNRYLQLKNLNQLFSVENYIDTYTILPTTDCNARCYYCYELGIKKYDMTQNTANDVAEFINKSNGNKAVHLRWFGGEPLCNHKVIDTIVDKLNKYKIKFKSSMISNALLFDEKLIEKATSSWNLKKVQITLDGTKDVYNKTKAYIDKTIKNPFEHVINNIKLLIKNKIFVSIRVNVGRKNIDDIINLIEYLDVTIGSNEYMTVYTTLLYGLVDELSESSVANQIFKQKLLELDKKIFETRLNTTVIEKQKAKLNNCMADNDHSIVIEPNGNLQKCEHISNDEIVGDIYAGLTNAPHLDLWKISDIPQKCQSCPLITQCNMLKKCSNHIYNCDDFYRQWLINKQKQKMQNTYKNFFSKYNSKQ